MKKYIEHQFVLRYQFFNEFCSRLTLVGEYFCSKPISSPTLMSWLRYVQWKLILGDNVRWAYEHNWLTSYVHTMFYHLFFFLLPTFGYSNSQLSHRKPAHLFVYNGSALWDISLQDWPPLLRHFWAPWPQSDPGQESVVEMEL